MNTYQNEYAKPFFGRLKFQFGKDESAKKVFEEQIHLNGDSFAKAHLGIRNK